VACDFFCVDTIMRLRYYVLFFIEPDTHRPHRALRQRAPSGRDVEYRPGRPIRRHFTCHGLINEYHAA
jgi:hypothetical protein